MYAAVVVLYEEAGRIEVSETNTYCYIVQAVLTSVTVLIRRITGLTTPVGPTSFGEDKRRIDRVWQVCCKGKGDDLCA